MNITAFPKLLGYKTGFNSKLSFVISMTLLAPLPQAFASHSSDFFHLIGELPSGNYHGFTNRGIPCEVSVNSDPQSFSAHLSIEGTESSHHEAQDSHLWANFEHREHHPEYRIVASEYGSDHFALTNSHTISHYSTGADNARITVYRTSARVRAVTITRATAGLSNLGAPLTCIFEKH